MTLSQRHLLFGGYCLVVTAVSAHVLRALVDYSRQDMAASHLVLIPFVTCILLYQSRNSVFESLGTAWRAGVCVVLAGLALSVAAALYRSATVPQEWLATAVAAVVVSWIGGFLLVYGFTAFRAALFPLLFLVFTIPISPTLLAHSIAILKAGSADVVSGLFTLTGTPYHREGFVFTLPGVAIEIADECSGIRSTIALLLTSLLAGHMYLKGGWTKAVLAVAILPVTIVKNGIRIVSLTLLAVYVDPAFLEGQLHRDGGLAFFLLALAILSPVFALLRRWETARRSAPEQA